MWKPSNNIHLHYYFRPTYFDSLINVRLFNLFIILKFFLAFCSGSRNSGHHTSWLIFETGLTWKGAEMSRSGLDRFVVHVCFVQMSESFMPHQSVDGLTCICLASFCRYGIQDVKGVLLRGNGKGRIPKHDMTFPVDEVESHVWVSSGATYWKKIAR